MAKFLAASALVFAPIGGSVAYAGIHLGGGHNHHPDASKPCYRHHHHHHHCKTDDFGSKIQGAANGHS